MYDNDLFRLRDALRAGDVVSARELVPESGVHPRCDCAVCIFARAIEAKERAHYAKNYPKIPDPERQCAVKVTRGKRWIRVDVGTSGRYMIDRDGTIRGIKAYGVPHPFRTYGTVWDTPLVKPEAAAVQS